MLMKKGLVGQLTYVKRAFLPGMAMQRQRNHVSSVMAAWKKSNYGTKRKISRWDGLVIHNITLHGIPGILWFWLVFLVCRNKVFKHRCKICNGFVFSYNFMGKDAEILIYRYFFRLKGPYRIT